MVARTLQTNRWVDYPMPHMCQGTTNAHRTTYAFVLPSPLLREGYNGPAWFSMKKIHHRGGLLLKVVWDQETLWWDFSFSNKSIQGGFATHGIPDVIMSDIGYTERLHTQWTTNGTPSATAATDSPSQLVPKCADKRPPVGRRKGKLASVEPTAQLWQTS